MKVGVRAEDPIIRAGVLAQLERGAELRPWWPLNEADVLVLAADHVLGEDLMAVREAARDDSVPIVLVVRELHEAQLLRAVECGVTAIVPRAKAHADELTQVVLAAERGAGVVPPDLLGSLLAELRRVHQDLLVPNGLTPSGLDGREVEVLRMLADGCDTAEIANALWYSERTVKTVVKGMCERLKLRNRTQVVAHAVRAGII